MNTPHPTQKDLKSAETLEDYGEIIERMNGRMQLLFDLACFVMEAEEKVAEAPMSMNVACAIEAISIDFNKLARGEHTYRQVGKMYPPSQRLTAFAKVNQIVSSTMDDVARELRPRPGIVR